MAMWKEFDLSILENKHHFTDQMFYLQSAKNMKLRFYLRCKKNLKKKKKKKKKKINIYILYFLSTQWHKSHFPHKKKNSENFYIS